MAIIPRAVLVGPATHIPCTTQTITSKPCKACSQSGIYVDYGGPDVGPVMVACRSCVGRGWINETETL